MMEIKHTERHGLTKPPVLHKRTLNNNTRQEEDNNRLNPKLVLELDSLLDKELELLTPTPPPRHKADPKPEAEVDLQTQGTQPETTSSELHLLNKRVNNKITLLLP